MNTGGVLLVWAILIGLYFVPTVVAALRKTGSVQFGPVIVINLFLGWTLIGWVVALAMAVKNKVS
jgi:hypothetical protein